MMTFKEASETVMTFGKDKGKTVDEIAKTDDGLKYLDWIAHSISLYGDIVEALRVYLNDPSIKKELVGLLEKERS